MPRAGGEADKLGNRYEAVWTVDTALDVLAGDVVSVTVEPFGDDAAGVDLVRCLPDGTREYHSVKRQTTAREWSVDALCRPSQTGRSILSEIISKLHLGPNVRVAFISGTGANDLRELAERAGRSADLETFEKHLATSEQYHRAFTPIAHLAGSRAAAFQFLCRVDVCLINERELIHRVQQRIAHMVYRPDGAPADRTTVRLLLAEFILDRLGQTLHASALWSYLSDNGYREKNWAHDSTLHARVADMNRRYVRHVEEELINGHQILRQEATTGLEMLTSANGVKHVLFAGAAGQGKSCVTAQTLSLLDERAIPYLALRMDSFPNLLTTEALGQALHLPTSPVVVLAGLTNGGHSVLVVDQLDAVSIVSGRNRELWDVFQSLMDEVSAYPNMRVLLACRAFDLDHDHRLRALMKPDGTTTKIALKPLEHEDVQRALAAAGIDPATLGARQLELLRTPLHLSLYLQGDPQSHGAFQSVQDLWQRYWDRKQQSVSQRLGRDAKWTEVIDRLAAQLSDRQTLAAPDDVLQDFARDAAAMTSEHVLVREHGTYRFFHEGFFDYAFARLFVSRGGDVIDLLVGGGREQHLFRRAQVRQILAYQRGRDRPAYLTDLARLLTDDRIRFHIKKVVFNWLKELDDPTLEEWQIVDSVRAHPRDRGHVLQVVRDRVAWFDLLDKANLWASYLSAHEASEVNEALWCLLTPAMLKARSARIAQLLRPYRGHGAEWTNRLRYAASMGAAHHSREMMNLFLTLLDDGVFDDAL